jgi:hypothetical protein
MFSVCVEFLYTCFGKGIHEIGNNHGIGMVPYMYALLGHWNDTLGMPFGVPVPLPNQISYIRRAFSLLG